MILGQLALGIFVPDASLHPKIVESNIFLMGLWSGSTSVPKAVIPALLYVGKYFSGHVGHSHIARPRNLVVLRIVGIIHFVWLFLQ